MYFLSIFSIPSLISKATRSRATRILFILGIAGSITACNKEAVTDDSERKTVNEWILNTMKIYYFWNESLMDKSFDLSEPSDVFFERLLYKRGQETGDRFSWYQASYHALLDQIYAKSLTDPGFAYSVILRGTEAYLQVEYIKPNSNALLAELKRGKLISHVNGTRVRSSNYVSLLEQASLHLNLVRLEGSDSNPQVIADGSIFFEGHTNFNEKPLLMDSLYTLQGSGGDTKKVGYLVYNRFISDRENGTNEYDIELNQRLAALKAGGAEYYILDLRYNRGGYMNCAIRLASALIPAEAYDAYLGSMLFNSTYQLYINQLYGSGGRKDYFVTSIPDGNQHQIPIERIEPEADKLYFLVGPNTASASEILIWGLNVFKSNRIVGSQTRGKFMGSYSLYLENDPVIKCGLQPLVCVYYNASNESGPIQGLLPDIEVPVTDLHPYALGDVREPLLQAAFAAIQPNFTSSAQTRTASPNAPRVKKIYESTENSYPQGAIIETR